MAYDLEEQEQIEQFKAWWAKWGNVITGVVALAALVSIGQFGWNWYVTRQASEAAAVFEQLQLAIDAKNQSLIRDTTGVLLDKYGRTSYAEMAALLAAHANAAAGDLKTAQAQLQWAADHASDDPYRYLARLRLAGVLLDQNQPDAALKVLDGDVPAPFASAFLDRRGDVYLAQNRLDDARQAYLAAKDKLAEAGERAKAQYEAVLDFKLEALASAVPAAPVPAAAPAPAPASAGAPSNPSATEKK